MNKYSPNNKLEACLRGIEQELMDIGDTPSESISEIRRYVRTFPQEPDYNLAQYSNCLIYYDQVRKFYEDCGYKTVAKWSDDKMWATYLRQVGYVARQLLKEK